MVATACGPVTPLGHQGDASGDQADHRQDCDDTRPPARLAHEAAGRPGADRRAANTIVLDRIAVTPGVDGDPLVVPHPDSVPRPARRTPSPRTWTGVARWPSSTTSTSICGTRTGAPRSGRPTPMP